MVSGRWDRWAVLAAASIGTVHGAIDRVKAQVDNRDGSTKGFLVDQLAHLIWLSTLAVWLGPKMTASRWTEAFGPDWVRALILTAGAIICVRATGFMIGFAVRPYLEEIKQAKVKSAPDFQSRGLTNGGRTIGQWERALIFLLVIVGQPGGIGFLIAAKSIFRFGELKDPDNRREAEYNSIGTLMSYGSAFGIAYATLWVANHLVR